MKIVGDGSPAAIISEIGSLLGKESPRQIIDRGACPYEGCRYGEDWLANADVAAYPEPPQMLGVALRSIPQTAVIPTDTWVTTVTGLVIAARHEGRVDLANLRTSYGAAVTNGPPLTNGQVVAIYSYLGEGCYTSWIDGGSYVLCNVDAGPGQVAQEWWVQVAMANGSRGWVAATSGAFVSEEGLNNELALVIADASLTLRARLLGVDRLLRRGANLDGDAGRYGTTAVEAAIRTKDVELLRMLLSRGLNLRRPCPAYIASQIALEPGGAAMLEALLRSGAELGCLTDPPLHAFLRSGMASDTYPIDRAITVAELLVKNGAVVDQRDSQGKSILDVLDDPEWASRVAALRSALVSMAGRN